MWRCAVGQQGMPVSGMTQKGERANMSIKEQLIRKYIDDEGNARKALPICAVCMNEISKYEIEAGMFEYVESKASKSKFFCRKCLRI